MTKQEIAQLKEMRETVKKKDDVYSQAALVQIEYLLECAREDSRRAERAQKGW